MDRLIALVGLRVRLNLRGYLRARETLLGLLFALPGLFLFSGLLAVGAFLGIRALERTQPDVLVSLLSAATTGVGLLVALSPVLSGVAWTEPPDAARLVHFPVPLGTVVAAALGAEFLQPTLLSQCLVPLAVTLALGYSAEGWVLAALGVALSVLQIVATAQAVGLALHGISRHRRLQDVAMLGGVLVSLSLSLMPFAVLAAGPGAFGRVMAFFRDHDVFALSPYALGVRAAVMGGQGGVKGFVAYALAAVVTLLLTMTLSALLMGAIHRGALGLGRARATGLAGRWLPRLPGTLGALVEKDLRAAWRDPAVRAALFASLIGPFVLLVFMTQAGENGIGLGSCLALAVLVGLGPFGSNAFGAERRGIMLLLGFPVARWRILVAKNLAQGLMRAPSLVVLGIALGWMVPWVWLAVAGTALAAVWLVAAGTDNLYSVLFPVTVPDPAQNPYAKVSGGRGAGTAVVGAAFMAGVVLAAGPFVFLAALPALLGTPALWAVTLPLALAGAAGVYALLVGAVARLLVSRECRVVSRILGDV